MTTMQVYKERGHFILKRWRWRLRAGNNRIVACSGEAFYSREDAVKAALRMGMSVWDKALGEGSTDDE